MQRPLSKHCIPYEYPPLPTREYFRRCLLHPSGSIDDDVVISIEVLPFKPGDPEAQLADYEALSYVWGTKENPLQIYVDIGTLRRTMLVTQNLHSALRHLRQTSNPRAMWIDAICINQGDNDEKGPCVAIMGKIYQNASRVVVWLGPAADNSDVILSNMSWLGSAIEIDEDTYEKRLAPGVPPTSLDLEQPVSLSEVEMISTTALTRREWFRRLWIRQEISFAKPNAIVTCGKSEVPWQILRKALIFHFHPGAQTFLPNRSLCSDLSDSLQTISEFLYRVRASNFSLMRHEYGQSVCSDPRDRIYAVLSIFDLSHRIAPDYNKSYQEVYQDTTLQNFAIENDLGILASCELATKRPPEMPTWVPDWSTPIKAWSHVGGLSSSNIAPHFTVLDQPTRPAGKQHTTTRTLRVSGLALAALKLVGPKQHTTPSHYSSDHIERLHATISALDAEGFARAPSLLEAYARTLFLGMAGDDFYLPIASLASLKPGMNLLARLFSGSLTEDALEDNELTPLLTFYWNLVGRRLAWDTHGNPVLCPEEAQHGDMVCVIVGARQPMLLRPFHGASDCGESDTPPQFEVVGACYRSEVSEGSALLGPLPEGVRQTYVYDRNYVAAYVHIEKRRVYRLDPRLEANAVRLGIDAEEEERKRMELGTTTRIEFDTLKEFVSEKTGNELRWFDLV